MKTWKNRQVIMHDHYRHRHHDRRRRRRPFRYKGNRTSKLIIHEDGTASIKTSVVTVHMKAFPDFPSVYNVK